MSVGSVGSGVRERVAPVARRETQATTYGPGFWAAVLVTADWLCAAAATLALFPADLRWPALGLVPVAWVVTTAIYRLYERRHLGAGSEEFRRVVRAMMTATAVVSAFCVLFIRSDRTLRSSLLALPVTGLLSLASRHQIRGLAAWRSDTGTRRAVLVGSLAQTRALTALLGHGSGFEPVAVYTTSSSSLLGRTRVDDSDSDVPVPAGRAIERSLDRSQDIDQLVATVRSADCDTVIVLPGPHLGPAALSRIGWQLQERGVEMLVAPFLTEIAASRVAVLNVGGVPLLHIRAPQLSRSARVPKEIAERICAVLGLVVLAPVFATIALAILKTSGRPVFFKQKRVGLNGKTFTLVKFRTMTNDAEQVKGDLAHLNENSDGLLFKMRADPRITKAGVVLRRYSLDELPQLLNVASGSMSLVGPRPPLPEEAARYSEEVRRRLLVKPGLTGLWQVSGRSDLPWDEAVRLDLGYVENWSLALDASILMRTGSAVVKGTGAY